MPTHHSNRSDLYTEKEPSSPTSTTSSYTLSDFPSQESPSAEDRPKSPLPRFLNVISKKIRSRSPSPAPAQDTTPRATTPVAPQRSPDNRTPTQDMSQPNSPSAPMPSRQASQDSTRSSLNRNSTDRSDFEKLAYGRHSSQWLFGDFSVSDKVKSVFKRPSSPS